MKRIKVTEAQMEQAWQNWVDFHYGFDCEDSIHRFFKWLDPENEDHDAIDPWTDRKVLKLLPSTYARFKMLHGPNHIAYLKVHYINHPWK